MQKNKYHLTTLGCQANLADSEKIAKILDKFGLTRSENEEECDLLIFNTCSIRQSAEDRVFGLNKKLRDLKTKNHKLKAILTGCMLHYSEKELRRRLPSFDFFIDAKNIDKLPKILGLKRREFGNVVFGTLSERDGVREANFQQKISPRVEKTIFPNSSKRHVTSALIPISYGCNNFCSYCIVPFARGKEVCRPPKEILKEIKEAVKNGAKEIWLLGQTVNSYRYQLKSQNSKVKSSIQNAKILEKEKQEIKFADLLRLINAIPGDFWIRFTSPHPKDFSDNLIKAMKECEKFAHYINLPVQSGNNEILKKMRRPYTVEHYKKIIARVRKAIPDIAISTDIIVGFPSETKKQFQDTVKLFKEVKFDMAYISEYSTRSKTLADKIYKDNVPHAEKERRKKFLNDEVLAKTALEHNKKLEGKTLKCFADKKGNIRTEGNKLVIVTGNYPIGEFFNVKITKPEPWKVRGEIVG